MSLLISWAPACGAQTYIQAHTNAHEIKCINV